MITLVIGGVVLFALHYVAFTQLHDAGFSWIVSALVPVAASFVFTLLVAYGVQRAVLKPEGRHWAVVLSALLAPGLGYFWFLLSQRDFNRLQAQGLVGLWTLLPVLMTPSLLLFVLTPAEGPAKGLFAGICLLFVQVSLFLLIVTLGRRTQRS